jgi:hypothetical protein
LSVEDGRSVARVGTAKARESSMSKVVVHSRSGSVFPGFARWNATGEELEIINRDGNAETFRLPDIKAVFFVRDFKGNRSYSDVKFLNKQHLSQHVWVRVELYDGEVIEGKVENKTELLTCSAIHLWPSDEDSNNFAVYIPKASIQSFVILSTE